MNGGVGGSLTGDKVEEEDTPLTEREDISSARLGKFLNNGIFAAASRVRCTFATGCKESTEYRVPSTEYLGAVGLLVRRRERASDGAVER
jgi:hypothetical protein